MGQSARGKVSRGIESRIPNSLQGDLRTSDCVDDADGDDKDQTEGETKENDPDRRIGLVSSDSCAGTSDGERHADPEPPSERNEVSCG